MKVSIEKQQALPLEQLRSLLYFDVQGIPYWKVRRSHCKAGSVAGTVTSEGYRWVMINGRLYVAHRLALFYEYGEWSENQIDHRNGIRSDNRIEELRQATRSQNKANSKRQSNNRSGYKGAVWFGPSNKYQVVVSKDKKSYFVGYFDTAEEAHLAYCKKAKELHGEFFRAG